MCVREWSDLIFQLGISRLVLGCLFLKQMVLPSVSAAFTPVIHLRKNHPLKWDSLLASNLTSELQKGWDGGEKYVLLSLKKLPICSKVSPDFQTPYGNKRRSTAQIAHRNPLKNQSRAQLHRRVKCVLLQPANKWDKSWLFSMSSRYFCTRILLWTFVSANFGSFRGLK